MSYLSATDDGASRLLFMACRITATPFAIYNYVDLLLRRILSFVRYLKSPKNSSVFCGYNMYDDQENQTKMSL